MKHAAPVLSSSAPRLAVLACLVRIAQAVIPGTSAAQDLQRLSENLDTRYFNFWEGTWYQLIDGRVDTTGTIFRVRRDVHRAAFVEDWRLAIGQTRLRATALRAWDRTAGRWMYAWVSDSGLFRSGAAGGCLSAWRRTARD